MTLERSRPPTDALVTIAVPAKDEAEAIEHTLQALPLDTLDTMGLRTEVLVLDGDSQDDTAAIARDWGATVVPDDGQGKGAALREARERFDGDLVVMLDADGTYPPDAIPRMIRPIQWGDADVVMGTRQVRPGSMKPTHRLGNALLSLQASVLYARPCPDLCTGLWAFRGDLFRALPLESTGFELEAELFATTARLGAAIERVPVDYLPRHGEPKLEGRRDGWRIAWRLIRSRFAPLENGSEARTPRASRGEGLERAAGSPSQGGPP